MLQDFDDKSVAIDSIKMLKFCECLYNDSLIRRCGELVTNF